MLILDAEIFFDKIDDNPDARKNDLVMSERKYRPAINFGDIYLSSGIIIFDKADQGKIAFRKKAYRVVIELPLIFEDEIFEIIKPITIKNGSFKIQEGSKIVGKGKILDYVYEKENLF